MGKIAPRIDFYILQEETQALRFEFACRLIEKAYRHAHRIYIHTTDQADAYTLDELLWTYRGESFLPHHLVGEGPDPAPPIEIGFQQKPATQQDILMNLSDTIPDFYPQFNRVIELVTRDPRIQALKRDHYRTYRGSGLDITTHQLSSSIIDA